MNILGRLTDGDPVLVLSPHLDDAVLSCGALLAAVADRCPVVVATVFTAAGPPPHTFAARRFLRGGDSGALYAARRREDVDVLSALGVKPVHLGFPDALFRRRRLPGAAARVLPELTHRYPTYRYDIARGRRARGDRTLVGEIAAAVGAHAAAARLILCPLGVGRHVDHLLVRDAGTRLPGRIVHYSDFPYDRHAAPDPAFLSRHRLKRQEWAHGIADKADLIRGYRTQAGGLFPDGSIIPAAPEVYYVADR